jgi:hypothetical protein
MRKLFVMTGLMLERLTQQQWFVFAVATLIALVPAMYVYDQANRTTLEMHRFAEGFSERLLESQVAERENVDAPHHPTNNDHAGPEDRQLATILDQWKDLDPEVRHAIAILVQNATLKREQPALVNTNITDTVPTPLPILHRRNPD